MPRLHKIGRLVAWTSTAILALAILLLAAGWWAVHRSVPTLDGTVRVRGLQAPVAKKLQPGTQCRLVGGQHESVNFQFADTTRNCQGDTRNHPPPGHWRRRRQRSRRRRGQGLE